MERNNSSNFSICRKIRQALASSPALRAIHRISHYHKEPKPVAFITDSNSPYSAPTHPAKHTAIQTKPPPPQHPKVNTEGSAVVIPIKFDYSTPTPMGNGNSASSMAQGQAAKVASPHVRNPDKAAKVKPEPRYVPWDGKTPANIDVTGFSTNGGVRRGGGQGNTAAAFKGEDNGKPKVETPGLLKGQQRIGLHSEQHGKKPLDINDTFTEYIQRAKYKIRTVSNVGGEESKPEPDEANCTNKEENQKDHFSDFIQLAKKKIRTTSNIGKTNSLKRG